MREQRIAGGGTAQSSQTFPGGVAFARLARGGRSGECGNGRKVVQIAERQPGRPPQSRIPTLAGQAHVRQRLDALERKLDDRRDIDRAKGLLMDRRGMNEAQAYAALRQQAMKQGLKLADVARRILAMADLLG